MLDRVEWLKGKGRTLERGEFRASHADRKDAYHRLALHEKMGHLNEVEASELERDIDACATLNGIGQLFVAAGLPELPARSPVTERRVSSQDRAKAVALLEKAYAEGRLKTHECAEAKDQVSAARTRNEIDAAFHGLSSPTRVAVANTAGETARLTTGAIREGGRRAGKAFRLGVYAGGALTTGVILLIAGIGTAALIFFLAAVLLMVGGAISLVTG
jgi:Domain of unknown function (DUF1707)